MKKKRRTGSGFSREEKELLARLKAGYYNMDDMIRILFRSINGQLNGNPMATQWATHARALATP